MRSIRRLVLAVSALAALALSVPGAGPIGPTALAAPGQAAATLGRDPQTGRLIFVGSRPGQPLPSPMAGITGVTPEQNAQAFIREHAEQLGLRDVDSELATFRTAHRADGRSVVRYRQVHNGIPVFAADVVVNTDRAGSLLALSAKLSPGLTVETAPVVTADEAVEVAVQAIAKYEQVDAETLQASTPELWIYDSRLVLPEGRPPVLTWKMEVGNGLQVREMVLVNALRPAIELHFNQVDTTWSSARTAKLAETTTEAPPLPGDAPPAKTLGVPLLSIYTMGNTTGTLPGSLVCTQASPGSCAADADAQNAYQYGLDTYNFYANTHGRDSIDGAGMAIVQSVHYGVGYMNAYWNGSQMVYGDGFSSADDVVGHELTHGVTENTSGLIYFGQSGAINESFSDIWGEFVDQTNGRGNDVPAVKWLMGEDVPGLGAIRSMKNPPAFKNPDSMTSAYYYTGSSDSYGVHTNSGVSNKTAYLMVEGGTFGGKTVTPLGLTKTAKIFYEAQTNLIGSGTNYLDLYYALQQACFDLVGTGGITMGDCQAVRDATEAVKMNKTKSATVYPTVDYCPVGQVVNPTPIFADDLEAGAGNWGTSNPSVWMLDNTRADSSNGSNALEWVGSSSASNEYVAMNADVSLPAGSRPYLRFEHDMKGFEQSGTTYYDGGIVEYSTNGGSTWSDLMPLFAGGKNYSGTLSNSWGNPLGGRKAFTGATVGYTESLYNLGSLAGRSFRFRLRAGSDSSGLSDPWFVDNVRIYTCVTKPSRPVLKLPANGSVTGDFTPLLDWTDSTGGVAAYNVQLARDSAFASIIQDVSGLLTSDYTVPGALDTGAKFYWRVRALNSAGDSAGWTAPFTFYTMMTEPTLLAPADAAAVKTRRPLFDWVDVGMATGYTLQVSTDSAFTSVVHTGTITKPISTYTPAADLPVNSLLYWHVRANSPKGPSPWSVTRSLTTANPPGIPLLVSPAVNYLTADLTPRFDWGAPILPVGVTFDHYEIQVADNDAFASPAIDVNVPGIDAHEYTPGVDLAAGTKFFWRVRAWSSTGEFSGWSLVRYIRTLLAAPTPSLPANASYNVLQRPAFDWSDVFGATGYTIQVSRASNFSSVLVTGNITTPISTYMPPKDLTSGPLYWHVRANGPNGPSAWSATWSVTVPNPPSTPALISPGNATWVHDFTPRFDWSMSTLPVGTTFDYYELQVWEYTGLVSYTVKVFSRTAHEYTFTSSLAYTSTYYYWRVRAVNTAGEASAWSTTRWFYVS
jgi:bacillolysin